MQEKPKEHFSPNFHQRIAGKLPHELDESIKYRQSLFKERAFTTISESTLTADLKTLNDRRNELNRLSVKTDLEDINASVNYRLGLLKSIGDKPEKQWEKKAREVELQVLRRAQEREKFILHVNAKNPTELDQSISYRESMIKKGKLNPEELLATNRELHALNKRLAELQRHRSKSNPKEIEASIDMRRRILGEIKGDTEVAAQKRTKLLVEIKILQDVIKEIQPKSVVKATRPPVSVVKVEDMKKDRLLSPESAKSKERIGRNGVIITPLVEDGVSIDGIKLRRGLDAQRIVSGKSSAQYVDNFKNLFSAELSVDEANIAISAAREKIKTAKVKRIPILKLITAAYMPGNSEMKVFLQRDCGFKGDDYDKSAKPALAYLRYLVENRVGNALEGGDTAVKALGNPVILEQNLRRILDVIKKDVHNMTTNFQNELPKGIPTSATPRVEDRDTLHLGLLIRQFSENAKARKEHRIDELVERFT